jgi:hypothetical protein
MIRFDQTSVLFRSMLGGPLPRSPPQPHPLEVSDGDNSKKTDGERAKSRKTKDAKPRTRREI